MDERNNQVEMDWYRNRGLQLRILEAVYFQSGKVTEGKQTKSVSGMVQKAVLQQIDNHARADNWCTASHFTIGKEANMNVGTRDKPNTAHVRRTIRLLQESGHLIEPNRKKRGHVKLRPNYASLLELTGWSETEQESILEQLAGRRVDELATDGDERRTADESGRRADNQATSPAPAATRKPVPSPRRTTPPARESTPPIPESTPPIRQVDAPNSGFDAPTGATKRLKRSSTVLNRSIKRDAPAATRFIDEICLGEEGIDRAMAYMDTLLAVVQFADVDTDPKRWRMDWEFCAKLSMLCAAGEIADADFWKLIERGRTHGQMPARYAVGAAKNWFTSYGKQLGHVLKQVAIAERLQPVMN